MRIGLLTGGGDCPGLNAVIRAVVKTAINVYGMEVMGIKDGYKGLVEDWIEPLNCEDVVGILPKGGTILGTSNRDDPFHYRVKKNNDYFFLDRSDQAVKNIEKNGIDALVVIGGDGTLTIAHLLHKKGVRVMGIPKTIDNDISATQMTFGFDTAVSTATEAIDRLHTTAESHHRVMVLEVMGRNAGWIALHSGMAGGADVIVIPEIPYRIEAICRKIEERRLKGRHFSIIVVAEGAQSSGGELVMMGEAEGNYHTPQKLGGISRVIEAEINDYMKEQGKEIEVRSTILGHLQRGGTPTPFDRILSTRYGSLAVEFLQQGNDDRMVCLQGNEIKTTLLEKALLQKKVDPAGQMVFTARSVGIYFGDEVDN